MSILLATLLLSHGPAVLPAVPQAAPGDLDARLERLTERMEAARVEHHIPGFALAVVRGEGVIYARGFGVADVVSSRPVTEETIFAIGSTTKAITATALGMLEDDGLLDFDDPVTEHLPYFELNIDSEGGAEGPVTLRDLLCHRTGFTRMSILWAGGRVGRQTVLETAAKAEPTAPFRSTFQYNNVMFLAAGMAGGAAAGVSWEELVQVRLLDPLGMESSTFTLQEAQEDPRLSLGYEWDADREEFVHKRMLDLKAIGPAGSINSNVLDMAQWVRFQLNGGEVAGKPLIQPETLEQIHAANMPMAPDTHYALGWMVHGEGDEQIIQHGGNIDGFGAQVAFMPRKDLGYVLLTNVSATPLQAGSMALVFDTLLEEEAAAPGEPAELDLDQFVGDYVADFAPFDGAVFEVNRKEDKLFVDVPGQINYELKRPDESGKWFFAMTDAIAVSFVHDESGQAIVLEMHQGGAIMELVREGVELPIEIPLDQLEKYLGTYRDPALKEDVHVVISKNRLALDIPSQRVYELHMPDGEGRRVMRMIDWIHLTFNEDMDGDVTSITMSERGQKRELPRIADPKSEEQEALPTLAEFHELRQLGGTAQLLAKHGTLRARGTYRMPQSGITGTYVYEARHEPRAYVLRIDMSPFAKSEAGTDGTLAWGYDSIRGYQELHGKEAEQTRRRHPCISDGDWSTTYDSVTIKERTEVDGVECLGVILRSGDLPSEKAYVELASGKVIRRETSILHGTLQIPTTRTLSDFTEIHGVQVPHTLIEGNPMVGKNIMTLLDLEVGVDLPEGFGQFQGTRD